MKRRSMWFIALLFAFGLSGSAVAQRHGGGRPTSTGLDHAEAKANSHGRRGIENAEYKQARHKMKKHKKHHRSH